MPGFGMIGPTGWEQAVAHEAIGIFDSGVGGLTVLHEIRTRLPDTDLIYLGDTARVPYGTKSPETVKRYALQAAEFLVREQVGMLVVACNTASSVALDALHETFQIPVVGVIEPGAEQAIAATGNRRIGVVGTEGTIQSGAYPQALQRLDPQVEVWGRACPLFVPLAEEGWAEHAVAHLCAEEYLAPLMAHDIDTLVLGCTHYPLLKKVLQQVLGAGVRLIDSAEATARKVVALRAGNGENRSTGTAGVRFFVTDVPNRFCRVGGSFLGADLSNVQQVDIDR
jgi:glutamate racemase